MNEPLQGMEPGDSVAYVTNTGTTCPAVLLSEPFRVMDGKTVEGTLGARLQVFNACFNEVILPGAGTIVPYSETPQAGCFFLTDKQRWNLDQWNGQKAQITMLNSNSINGVASPMVNCTGINNSAGIIGMTGMGGPLRNNATPDGALSDGALHPPPHSGHSEGMLTPALAGHNSEDDETGESPPVNSRASNFNFRLRPRAVNHFPRGDGSRLFFFEFSMSQTISRTQIGSAAVIIARRFDGVREEPLGSNSGPMVRKFQAATPLAKEDPTGWPWCAAFMAYVFALLWLELGIAVLPVWNPSASCDVLLSWARKKGILYASNAADAKKFKAKLSEPKAFDVFLSMKSAGDATHTGLVEAVQADLDIETIEGNTNTNGSREGIGVFQFIGGNARHEQGRCYIRWLELLPATVVVAPPTATPLLPGITAVPAKPTPAPVKPAAPKKAPRLILAIPPYSDENYKALSTARLENGNWTVDGAELSEALAGLPLALCTTRTPDNRPVVLPGRAKLRDHLRMAGIVLDDTRTRLGNHTSEANDPRQYAFIASGANKE